MAKKRSQETDKHELQKKVKERRAQSENPEGDRALRLLRRRLKRVQRKLRNRAARIKQAAGKKTGTTPQG